MAGINYYRSDGWVKNVQGQAIPGAQVYVLTQPANVVAPITPPRTTPVPFVPNPQALIYTDQGNTPLSQPVITDGFGHYDFYVLPGLYTVAVYLGGILQNFYVDQSIGNVGSAGGAGLSLETNGTPNFNQALQNLEQGANITIVTDNFGNTVITGASPNPPFSSGTPVTPLAYRVFNGMLGLDGYIICRVPASAITSFPSRSKFTMDLVFVSSPAPKIQAANIARTLPNDTNVIDRTAITWGGNLSPTLGFGFVTSDEIVLQIDSGHDYWFCISPQFGVDFQFNCAQTTSPVEGGRPASDPTSGSPLPSSVSNAGSVFLLSWFGTVYP